MGNARDFVVRRWLLFRWTLVLGVFIAAFTAIIHRDLDERAYLVTLMEANLATLEEARAVAGPPDFVRESAGRVMWQYCHHTYLQVCGPGRIVLVARSDGRIIEQRSVSAH